MISLTDDHKSHLSLLFDQPAQVLQDFCKMSLELLKKGPNIKLYTGAAQKLQVEARVIQLTVEALVQLFLESRRHSLSVTDFQNLVLASGFTEGQETVLSEFVDSNSLSFDEVLHTLSPTLLHYHDLEWRFDVQVASRALLKQITPTLTMKLTLEERPSIEEKAACRRSLLLQTDPNNLKHIVQKLEEAVKEASSQHSRRLQRVIK